jgi:AcrR family transcriptional regulator
MTKHKDNAREKLMRAMLDIVGDEGAAALTYDSLVARSGLTRGGVMYHFPSKESMLQGLVEHYMQQELGKVQARWESYGKTVDGLLRAELECAREADQNDQHVSVSLLPVILQSPAMMANIRHVVEGRYTQLDEATAGFEQAAIALLVIDAFEMSKAFGFNLMPEHKRQAILKRLLRQVDEEEG